MLPARTLWLKTHPLPTIPDQTRTDGTSLDSAADLDQRKAKRNRRASKGRTNYETKPIIAADPPQR